MYKIFLPKKIEELDSLSGWTFANLSLFRANNMYSLFLSTSTLSNQMGLTSKRQMQDVRDNLRDLEENNIIKIIYGDTGSFIIDPEYFDICGDKFTLVYYEDMSTIVNSGFRHRFQLLKYYIVVMGTINNKTKYGSMSMSWLAKKMNVNYTTIINYNKELEKLNIICVEHNNNNPFDNNRYAHYSNKGVLNNVKSNSSANWRRSVSAKYNYYLANRESISGEEAMMIYELCKAYNNEMDELQLKQPGDDYKRRKKDLSVF